MQNFYNLKQGRTEKVTLYVTNWRGALNVVQQEYPTMLSANEVQQLLMDQSFLGLCKQLQDSMCYLYKDARITYPQLMTAAWKVESEHEDHTGEGICVRSIQAEGKDDIMILSEQIAQL